MLVQIIDECFLKGDLDSELEQSTQDYALIHLFPTGLENKVLSTPLSIENDIKVAI